MTVSDQVSGGLIQDRFRSIVVNVLSGEQVMTATERGPDMLARIMICYLDTVIHPFGACWAIS